LELTFSEGKKTASFMSNMNVMEFPEAQQQGIGSFK